jgi:catechol 2,3-dioxygenase-like lactoylglutathione lyase family enzyme
MFEDPAPPRGALSAQLAFRVPAEAVDECAAELTAAGVTLVSPPTDQPWGHRTLFFRDPDGNVLEIFADI